MKRLSEYIIESKGSSSKAKWLESVKAMYGWYCENFPNFYDSKHHYDDENYKECELIGNKKVMADCSGFVAACLCLAGYSDHPLDWNVRLGSFNLHKNANPEKELSHTDKEYVSDLCYMADIDAFECHKITDEKKEKKDYSEIKAGDILVKGSHVTIAADDGAKHLYDWGRQIMTQNDKTFRRTDPVKFYIPKDVKITYPYRSYWRLK